MNRSSLLMSLSGVFVASVVLSNAVSANIITVGPFTMAAGALLYPILFLITDVISEVFGKKKAQIVVATGFVAQVIAVLFVQFVALWDPVDSAIGEAWSTVFLPMWRIAAGSMIAYLVAQTIDVHLFHRLKEKTNGRYLWLRNNISTIVSQAIDTLIFVTVAFFGVVSDGDFVSICLGQYSIKVIIAILDTPLCYLAVALISSNLPKNQFVGWLDRNSDEY